MFQVNTDFQIHGQKIFLHNSSYIPPSLEQKMTLSFAESFRNIHFLTNFY